jgi:hypothetical protein
MTVARPVAVRRLYPAIGEFVVQYAIVQGIMRTVLLSLVGVRTSGGAALVYGMSDSVLVKKTRFALVQYGKGYNGFEPALKKLSDVTKFRDQIVHWVPYVNSSRTTLEGWVNENKDYKNPSQPQLNCKPDEIQKLTDWLHIFEWDLITVIKNVERNQRFVRADYVTLEDRWTPAPPKAAYHQQSDAVPKVVRKNRSAKKP